MFLTSAQRKSLMETTMPRKGAGSRIAAIDAVVARLRHENPNAFHSAQSLEQRVFFHAPDSDIPHLAAIKLQPDIPPRQDGSVD
ncbi:hypothetical protein AWB80_02176 [Caballeronia pedi]|uniref:Uncharacterized protein n=1 Tax=Caballeronia pedi TaxID=1777141 RepID=A0A158AER5_9BURK|nr:hypothetical protein [Caballeronia pedi]SAK56230.1 hypothetical protein AWB80_02176 [Caballeronia pedi]